MEGLLQRRWLCLALVGVLSMLVHAKGLRAPLLDYHFHRQVNTASIARTYWREARPIHKPRIDWEGPQDRLAGTELPVYMWLYGKLWPAFGLGEGWGRLISAAASLATALLLFGLFEREFGREAALWGAALFSCLPVEVYFGRTVQPEATALLALVGALVLWERALRPGRNWGAWAGAVACAFVAVGLKLPYVHLLIPLAALSWRRLGKDSLTDARTWCAGLLAMGGVIAWYARARSGVYVVPTHGDEYAKLLSYGRLLYFMQFQVLSRFPELVATYGGLVLFFLGAREVLVRRRDAFWIAWFGGVALHLFALAGYAHYHEYTALPMAPVVAGLIGVGAARLRARAPAAVLALLILSVPAHAALRINHWYRQGYGYLAQAGQAAAAVSAPSDLFLTNCQASSVLLYYLDRRGWSFELDLHPTLAEPVMADAYAKGARFIASEKRGLFAAPDGTLWRRLSAAGPPAWDDGTLVIFPLPRDGAGNGKMAATR
ncbi:MAG: glycosyltransferase family 39 protein [Elusimicrobia bacterium]|nr:glycosyltransferase family 39 protein [Elusimicrobiota bacterium]